MDYVVHVNNGSNATSPIVLRLLPGEEKVFNLKVVNHGEPSNISLEATNPVLKAVSLKKPDHYIVMEETIPVRARMPSRNKRLDGEIILTGNKGTSRVPISLLSDSEDPGIDLEDPTILGDADLRDDIDDQDIDPDDDDFDGLDQGDEEPFGGRANEPAVRKTDDEDEDTDYEHDEFKRDLDEDDEDADGSEHIDGMHPPHEREVRRIVFTKDRDLERYRSATRTRSSDRQTRDRENSDIYRGYEERREPKNIDTDDNSIIDRIGDRARERISSQEYASNPDDFGQDRGYGNQGYSGSSGQSAEPAIDSENNENDYDNGPMDILDNIGGTAAIKIIPAIIFIVLVLVMVLTFVTETIPEFPGALGSSILIVTLIIYGAATLLKA